MIAGGAFPDGDAVPDGDLLGADEDVFDQQPQHALAFGDAGVLGVVVELGEEAFQIAGELGVGLAVGELGIDGGGLAAQVGFAGSQGGHPGAQLVDGDQLFGERLDHPGDRGGSLGELRLQPFALPGGRVAGAGLLEALADLGPDERGIGEQVSDVVPDDGVEVVGADRLVAADPPALVAVVIRAQAPVVVDLLVRGAGRGPVVAIPAGRTRGQALEQGRDLAVAGGVSLVVGKAPGGPLERLGAHDGGTGISIQSSRGRSTVLDARGVERPSSRARRFSPGCCCRTCVLPNTRCPRKRDCAACPRPPTGPSGPCRSGWGRFRW